MLAMNRPPDNRADKQAARLRRFLLALPVYAVMAVLLYLAHVTGLISLSAAIHGLAAMFAANALVFALLRSGLNQRFTDPSLTWLQIFLASAILLYVVYQFDRERNFALMMCLVIFMFGAFRFTVRQFMLAAVQFLAGLALVIFLLMRNRPDSSDLSLLGLQWIALALVLPCFAFIGGKLSELRQRLRTSNEGLVSALATIQRSAKELRENEERFRKTFDFASIGMAIVALDGKWTQVNAALCELLGYSADELRPLSFQDLTHPDDLQADLGYVQQILLAEINTYQMEKRYFHKDGHIVWALLSVSLVRDVEGSPVHFVSQIQDITARKQAEQALGESEARFRATFDHASVGIMHSSLDRRILVVNRKFCEMVGYSAEELQQGSVRKIHHPEDSDADQHLEKQLLAGEIENFSFEKRYIRKDGSLFWANRSVSLVRDHAGRPAYFIRVIEDISARKAAEEKLLHLANFDVLTDLPNRAMFHDRLSQALVQARRRGERVGVMFLDVDKFKLINDTLGHDMGDALLRQVARRLCDTVRPGDTVGRLSGDEFGILLSDLRNAEDAGLVAQKIVNVFGKPFQLGEHTRQVTGSIGISLYPGDGGDNETLLKAADAAMYRAKARGRNNFAFFRGADAGKRDESAA
jgi:diguanylate cyclase (GGDEF)-like protein/PAS domain S-box-containing protein